MTTPLASFVSLLISAIVQGLVFLLVPFFWWLASARRTVGFFGWLGWRRPVTPRWSALAVWMAGAFVGMSLVGGLLVPWVVGRTASSQFAGLGWGGLPAVLVYALAQTAFSEESLFRGFLLKRVAARFGFWVGNATQATLFGLMHAVPFWLIAGPGPAVGTGVFTLAVGLLMGFINERLAGGSLLPGWCIHAASNVLTGSLALVGIG